MRDLRVRVVRTGSDGDIGRRPRQRWRRYRAPRLYVRIVCDTLRKDLSSRNGYGTHERSSPSIPRQTAPSPHRSQPVFESPRREPLPSPLLSFTRVVRRTHARSGQSRDDEQQEVRSSANSDTPRGEAGEPIFARRLGNDRMINFF